MVHHYLIAEDDQNMRVLIQRAYGSLVLQDVSMHYVEDGQEAIDYLAGLIQPGNLQMAVDALMALGPMRSREEIRARVETAVKAAGSARLEEAFRKAFGG